MRTKDIEELRDELCSMLMKKSEEIVDDGSSIQFGLGVSSGFYDAACLAEDFINEKLNEVRGENIKSDFRENLKRMMSEKDISLRELAEIIGISDVRMCKIATEDVVLRPLEVLNMLIYFDCKHTELFGNMFDGCFEKLFD